MVGEIFSVQAYHHLLTVVSSMITRKLNPRVYDSLLVLLDAVHLYRVYRQLDTFPLYLYDELWVICDYATRYPEAILLCCRDAHQVAEELIVFFSRMGIPREILSD